MPKKDTFGCCRPELRATLETCEPKLDASMKPAIVVAGIKDVQVDGNSVVNHQNRVANIPLGKGLEFRNGVLCATNGGDAAQLVEIRSLSGEFTLDEITAILNQARIAFGATVYYLSQRNGDQLLYQSFDEFAQYDHINIHITLRTYEVLRHEPSIYDNHLADSTIHITDEERQFWNDKVSCSSPEGTDLIVFTTD